MSNSLGWLNQYWDVILVAFAPLIETTGAVSLALFVYHLDPWTTFWLCMVGQVAAFILVYSGLHLFTTYLRRTVPAFRRIFDLWVARNQVKHSPSFERWGAFALFLFVMVPFPLTGVWSGCLLAYIFGISWPKAALGILSAAAFGAWLFILVGLGGLQLVG